MTARAALPALHDAAVFLLETPAASAAA